MGKKIKSHARKIFNRILQILGITSIMAAMGCTGGTGGDRTGTGSGTGGQDNIDDMICYYGSPSNSYVLSGKITDPEGNGIEDIKVGVTPVNKRTYESKYAQTALTDEEGNYILKWNDNSCRFEFVLTAIDIDGVENGYFDKKDVEITFTDENHTDSYGYWADEYTIRDKNISLDPVEPKE